MRTLIIADNQDITKAGILYLSDRMPDLSLVTEAADKHELLQLLQQQLQLQMKVFNLKQLNSKNK